MMNLVKKIGNIKAYAENNTNSIQIITLINGGDIIAQEVYFTDDIQMAVNDLLSKTLDIFTEDYIFLCVPNAERLTENTYKSGRKDWFCRIDGTSYFQHYFRTEDEFIRDKNGLKIIDK